MRIAFLVVKNIARGGGIEKYTLGLGSRLVKRGHEVTVYSMRHYGKIVPKYMGMNIVPVFSIKKASLQKLSASFSAAWRVLLNGGFDIVHLHSVAAGAFGILPRLRGSKTVLQMHGIEWQRSRWGRGGSEILKILEKISILQSCAITAVSQTQCNYFKRVYDCPMHYVSSATEIKPRVEAREIYGLGLKPSRYLLFASRLVREKGAHYLIPAFKQIDTDMKLVIAGNAQGEEDYKRELIDLANNDSRILFPGFVEGRLLEELFSNAYLYVQPSLIEGLSIALLEAMSYGNCCLVSNIPENIEAIEQAGFTFKSQDVNDLTGKIRFLLDNHSEIDAKSQQAISRVKANYTWDSVTDKIERLYESVLAS